MGGTTKAAKVAMRLTPPMTMKASAMTTPMAVAQVGTPHAEFRAEDMPLAWTPGRKKLIAKTVKIAKVTA